MQQPHMFEVNHSSSFFNNSMISNHRYIPEQQTPFQADPNSLIQILSPGRTGQPQHFVQNNATMLRGVNTMNDSMFQTNRYSMYTTQPATCPKTPKSSTSSTNFFLNSSMNKENHNNYSRQSIGGFNNCRTPGNNMSYEYNSPLQPRSSLRKESLCKGEKKFLHTPKRPNQQPNQPQQATYSNKKNHMANSSFNSRKTPSKTPSKTPAKTPSRTPGKNKNKHHISNSNDWNTSMNGFLTSRNSSSTLPFGDEVREETMFDRNDCEITRFLNDQLKRRSKEEVKSILHQYLKNLEHTVPKPQPQHANNVWNNSILSNRSNPNTSVSNVNLENSYLASQNFSGGFSVQHQHMPINTSSNSLNTSTQSLYTKYEPSELVKRILREEEARKIRQ